MRYLRLMLGLLSLALLASCAGMKASPDKLPQSIKFKKGQARSSDVAIVMYLPKHTQTGSTFLSGNRRIDYGDALTQGITDVTGHFLPQAYLYESTEAKPYALLVDLEPEWDIEYGGVTLKLGYKVYDTTSQLLLEGESAKRIGIDYQVPTATFYSAAVRSTQLMVVDILKKLGPTKEKYATIATSSDIDKMSLADMEEPISNGTGFVINNSGTVMTAAHVLDECLVTRVHLGEQKVDASTSTMNHLLDLALIQTDLKTTEFLPLKKTTDITLGEKVSVVSFPLKGLLAASANVTSGNVSSKSALEGSFGLFQFSAPIQPGSSGGAVVLETGEFVGVVTSTLNVSKLAEKGIIPQNVNFALKPQYIKKFLDKHQVDYVTNGKKVNKALDRALESTVRIACYQ